MTGLKGEQEKGPVYTISSSTICTSLEDDSDSNCCCTEPSGSNLIKTERCVPLSGKVIIDMNSVEPITVPIVNCETKKTAKNNNHVRFSLEDSYSDNVYLKPYYKYPKTIYRRESSFKENLKTLCQTFTEFMKKAGKWCCLVLVILGLILFFCLKVDFHR